MPAGAPRWEPPASPRWRGLGARCHLHPRPALSFQVALPPRVALGVSQVWGHHPRSHAPPRTPCRLTGCGQGAGTAPAASPLGHCRQGVETTGPRQRCRTPQQTSRRTVCPVVKNKGDKACGTCKGQGGATGEAAGEGTGALNKKVPAETQQGATTSVQTKTPKPRNGSHSTKNAAYTTHKWQLTSSANSGTACPGGEKPNMAPGSKADANPDQWDKQAHTRDRECADSLLHTCRRTYIGVWLRRVYWSSHSKFGCVLVCMRVSWLPVGPVFPP